MQLGRLDRGRLEPAGDVFVDAPASQIASGSVGLLVQFRQ
jgi:hypothetical protein